MDDSRTKKITIVGGGIIGCLVALQFQKKKYDVTIIEQKKNLGGILRDFQIENDFFFKGCQYLENDIKWIDQLKSLIHEEFVNFKFNYASHNSFNKDILIKKNLAVPIFKLNDLTEEEFNFKYSEKETLYDRVLFYPKDIKKKLISFLKNCGINPKIIHSSCAENLQISRVNVDNFEKYIISLKEKNNFYDERLAVPRNKIYPNDLCYSLPINGYSSLFDSIYKAFKKIGIKIELNTNVEPIWVNQKLSLKYKGKIFDDTFVFWSGNPTKLIFNYNKKKLNSHVFKTFQISANILTNNKENFFLQNFSDRSKILRIQKYFSKNNDKIGIEFLSTVQTKNFIINEALEILKNLNLDIKILDSSLTKYVLPRFDIFTVFDQKIISNFQNETYNSNLLFSPWLIYGRKNKIRHIDNFLNTKKFY